MPRRPGLAWASTPPPPSRDRLGGLGGGVVSVRLAGFACSGRGGRQHRQVGPSRRCCMPQCPSLAAALPIILGQARSLKNVSKEPAMTIERKPMCNNDVLRLLADHQGRWMLRDGRPFSCYADGHPQPADAYDDVADDYLKTRQRATAGPAEDCTSSRHGEAALQEASAEGTS